MPHREENSLLSNDVRGNHNHSRQISRRSFRGCDQLLNSFHHVCHGCFLQISGLRNQQQDTLVTLVSELHTRRVYSLLTYLPGWHLGLGLENASMGDSQVESQGAPSAYIFVTTMCIITKGAVDTCRGSRSSCACSRKGVQMVHKLSRAFDLFICRIGPHYGSAYTAVSPAIKSD